MNADNDSIERTSCLDFIDYEIISES